MVVCVVLFVFFMMVGVEESVCFGIIGNGWFENGVKLLIFGENYEGYSIIVRLVGRIYVYLMVRDIVLSVYMVLEID